MELTAEQAAELAHLGRTCSEAKAILDNAKATRVRAIKRVAAQGAGYRSIGKAAGVSYQRVAQIVSGRAPDAMPWNASLEIKCPNCGAPKGEQCVNATGRFHHERHEARLAMFLNDHPWLR